MSKQQTRSTINAATALIALLTALTLTTPVVAGAPAQHSGAASSHAIGAVAHSATAAVKGVSAIAAVPLIGAGASGMASAAAGSALHEFANEPLRVGHEIIHTSPQSARNTPTPAAQMANADQSKKH